MRGVLFVDKTRTVCYYRGEVRKMEVNYTSEKLRIFNFCKLLKDGKGISEFRDWIKAQESKKKEHNSFIFEKPEFEYEFFRGENYEDYIIISGCFYGWCRDGWRKLMTVSCDNEEDFFKFGEKFKKGEEWLIENDWDWWDFKKGSVRWLCLHNLIIRVRRLEYKNKKLVKDYGVEFLKKKNINIGVRWKSDGRGWIE